MHRHGGQTVVATYGATSEAEVVASALRANGFAALVTADDCAGMDPYLHVLLGVHVVVPEVDAAAASDCLGGLLQPASESVAAGEMALGKVPFSHRRPFYWTVAAMIIGVELLALTWLLLDDCGWLL